MREPGGPGNGAVLKWLTEPPAKRLFGSSNLPSVSMRIYCLRYEALPDGSLRILDLSLVDDDHLYGKGGDWESHIPGEVIASPGIPPSS